MMLSGWVVQFFYRYIEMSIELNENKIYSNIKRVLWLVAKYYIKKNLQWLLIFSLTKLINYILFHHYIKLYYFQLERILIHIYLLFQPPQLKNRINSLFVEVHFFSSSNSTKSIYATIIHACRTQYLVFVIVREKKMVATARETERKGYNNEFDFKLKLMNDRRRIKVFFCIRNECMYTKYNADIVYFYYIQKNKYIKILYKHIFIEN